MYMETKRLIIRKPEQKDVDDYLEIRNSEFVLKYNGMEKTTRERVARRFLEETSEHVLVKVENGKVIGIVSVDEDSLRYGVESRELSYFLSEEESRKGYMKEALTAVIDELFREENLQCVAARSFAPNVASRKLLESLGFHQDGYIPQCVRGYGNVIFDDTLYSLFRDEWK